jgi:myosin heavy subunit
MFGSKPTPPPPRPSSNQPPVIPNMNNNSYAAGPPPPPRKSTGTNVPPPLPFSSSPPPRPSISTNSSSYGSTPPSYNSPGSVSSSSYNPPSSFIAQQPTSPMAHRVSINNPPPLPGNMMNRPPPVPNQARAAGPALSSSPLAAAVPSSPSNHFAPSRVSLSTPPSFASPSSVPSNNFNSSQGNNDRVSVSQPPAVPSGNNSNYIASPATASATAPSTTVSFSTNNFSLPPVLASSSNAAPLQPMNGFKPSIASGPPTIVKPVQVTPLNILNNINNNNNTNNNNNNNNNYNGDNNYNNGNNGNGNSPASQSYSAPIAPVSPVAAPVVTPSFTANKQFSSAQGAPAAATPANPGSSSFSGYNNRAIAASPTTQSSPPSAVVASNPRFESVLDKYYWLPHPKHLWFPARCVDGNQGILWEAQDKLQIKLASDKVKPMSAWEEVSQVSFENKGIANLIDLDDQGEGPVLHCVKKRYTNDSIYTYIGTILIAINPYKTLPIYSLSMMKNYQASFNTQPPHVFAIAAEAYQRLLDEKINQSVIISGESGAGKTESTKYVLNYLSAVAGSTTGVEQEILHSNPILESFGNAKTLRNNNSSRFGKWMEIKFEPGGKIVAAQITNYLLEKSRVVTQTRGERSYHIQYMLCAGLPEKERKELDIKEAKNYKYLNKSGCLTVPGHDEKERFEEVVAAMGMLKFSKEEQFDVWKMTAAVLHIGNLEPALDDRTDKPLIKNQDVLQRVAGMLEVELESLNQSLCYRAVTIKGDTSHIPLKLAEMEEARDALAKAVYGNLFNWLIAKINTSLGRHSAKLNIGILDIFGFEIFELNSFEQFCINFANEKLQQHFNNHVFKTELADYKREGIPVEGVKFVDNSECLELIEKRPNCILAMIDEELVIPGGSDESVLIKMTKKFSGHNHYTTLKQAPQGFVIRHYAGDVCYTVNNFLVKNKDKIHPTLENMLKSCKSSMLKKMFGYAAAGSVDEFDNYEADEKKQKSSKVSSSATLGLQFQTQLQDLIDSLNRTDPLFIRCIKPNSTKEADHMDGDLVLRQLRYAGLFEAIRIRKAGYAFRKTFSAFCERYAICLPKLEMRELKRKSADQKTLAINLLQHLSNQGKLDSVDFQIGLTKIYMRSTQRALMERLRDGAMESQGITIQAVYKGYRAKKNYKPLRDFYRKVNKTLQRPTVAELELIIRDAQQKKYDWLFVLQKAKSILQFLLELQKVEKLLIEASGSKDQQHCENVLVQAERIESRHNPAEHGQIPESFVKAVAKLREIVQWLQRRNEAKAKLLEAIRDESLESLEVALAAVQDASLKLAAECAADISKAKQLITQLKQEEEVMNKLRDALKSAKNDLIYKAIQAAKKIRQNSDRANEIQEALNVLQGNCDELLNEAITLRDTTSIKAELIPMFTGYGLTELVATAKDYCEQQKKSESAAKKAKKEAADAAVEEALREKQEAARRARAERAAKAESEREEKDLAAKEAAEARAAARASAMERSGSFGGSMLRQGSFMGGSLYSGGGMSPVAASRTVQLMDYEEITWVPYAPDYEAEFGPETYQFDGSDQARDERQRALKAACEARNATELSKLLASAQAAGDSSRQMKIAASLQAKLKSQMGQKFKFFKAIEMYHDKGTLQKLVAEAAKQSYLDVDKLLAKAKILAFGPKTVAKEELDACLNDWMNLKSYGQLYTALEEVDAADGVEATETIDCARMFIIEAIQSKAWTVQQLQQAQTVTVVNTGPANESKIAKEREEAEARAAAVERLHKVYNKFTQTRGSCSIDDFPDLREEENYVKRSIFGKASTLKQRFMWQKGEIPRSLIRISTAYCHGDKKNSQRVKLIAKHLFDCIRQYMGDEKCNSQPQVAMEIIKNGVDEPLLRDEIYCQLIKQTTKNPGEHSMALGMKLLYLCISTFPCSGKLTEYVLAHLAALARPALDDRAVGFNSVTDLATQSFIIYDVRSFSGVSQYRYGNVRSPTVADIDRLTKGDFAPVQLVKY